MTGEAEHRMNPTRMVASRDSPLPYDDGAERSVLSAMMLSADALGDILPEVSESDFHGPSNATVFSAMRRLFDEGKAVDPVAIADVLRSEGRLDAVGGYSALLDLANDPFAIASWRQHVGIVRRNSTLRRMIYASAKISALAYDAPEDTREVVDAAERMLLSVTERGVGTSYSTLADVMDELYENLCEQVESGSPEGTRTGFPGIDRSLLGLRGGQMVVVGARPGVGKTSFCLNLATNVAESGSTVALFSLEMSKEEIGQRLLSARSGVPLTDIRSASIREDQWQRLLSATEELRVLPILIDDIPGTTVTEIRAKARRMLHGRDGGVVIVDYLQLLSSPKGSGRDSRATQVGEMSRGIKIMAKDLGVPVVALSQLNREVEGRNNKRPQLSDLRESGSIEQDADVVILLDRSMTPEEADRKDRPDYGVTDFIIAKNRSGPLGKVSMAFDGGTILFRELDTFHVA